MSNWTGVLCFDTVETDGHLHVRELYVLHVPICLLAFLDFLSILFFFFFLVMLLYVLFYLNCIIKPLHS